MAHNCRVCGDELTDDNWKSSGLKKYDYICKKCTQEYNCSWREENPEYYCLYKEANPEKAKVRRTRSNRQAGHLPMSKNKECPSYLGVHVNEGLLKQYFDDVEVMPYGNPGYDFICNNGWKIDGKSSCLNKDGGWAFTIRHNTIADYFFLVAYDNREDLNPLHIWLIPGHVLNHLSGAYISLSTIDKWSEYEQPIDELIICCDTIKSNGDNNV